MSGASVTHIVGHADMSHGACWIGCECCGLVSALSAVHDDAPAQHCPRCGNTLHWRKPMSLQRTWAYLVASAVLYVPANALPIMSTTTAFRESSYTLLGGIAELWADQAWGLAVLVFVASIVVPMLKIGALALLAWSVRYAPLWRPQERARLFGVIEAVGHWSMLDVYVVVLLVAMVRFGDVADAHPEPGLLAFAAVVVLTMLAAHSFDPKLIWQDTTQDNESND
jgi:paraquat-inducible protein A